MFGLGFERRLPDWALVMHRCRTWEGGFLIFGFKWWSRGSALRVQGSFPPKSEHRRYGSFTKERRI